MPRGDNLRKHGLTGIPEHRAWCRMMTRCHWLTPESEDWELYQGRGIGVCPQWHEFAQFYSDMGSMPTPKHTLDRIDSEGNYEPSNCRWATQKQQANNKRSNRRITINGETKNLQEWAELAGVHASTMHERIAKYGATERVLLTPKISIRDRNSRGRYGSTLTA